MTDTPTGSRVDWPRGWDRTPPEDRTRNNSFDVTLSKAFNDLETELSRLGVEVDGDEKATEFRYSFDARQRKRDQRPYSRASPDDPGFVLRWKMEGAEYAVACDRWSRLRDNVRSVGLYLREKRKMENRPVATGQDEFANAQLPPADDEAIAMGGTVEKPEPHEVLGVEPDAPEAVVRGAARSLKAEHHPDNGGDEEAFKRVTEAEEAMLDG